MSDTRKAKRRVELLELCQNASEMKQQKLKEDVESFDWVGGKATDKPGTSS